MDVGSGTDNRHEPSGGWEGVDRVVTRAYSLIHYIHSPYAYTSLTPIPHHYSPNFPILPSRLSSVVEVGRVRIG